MSTLKSILAILAPLVRMIETVARNREEKKRRAKREAAYDDPAAAMSEHFGMLSKDADEAQQASNTDDRK